ncbi:MAG: LysE family transporter [Saprospiraceae bacterium]|nr:LysE family transporter [Saprospiraceae bacterium]
MILLEGILLGLIPAFMAGPLTIALMYTAIEKSTPAGLSVGLGIWVSDIIYILAVYFGFNYLMKLSGISSFNWSLGGIGSAILIAIGIGILLKKQNFEEVRSNRVKTRDLLQAFWKGFAINTFNPVAVIFWTSVMGAIIIERNWGPHEATLFFSGTMISVIGSDFLKVILAKWLTKWLTPKRWQAVSKISGYLFIIFGIMILVRVAMGV